MEKSPYFFDFLGILCIIYKWFIIINLSIMGYENWENWWKSKEQIESEIHKASWESVYQKIIYVVKKMIDDIKSDENIPYRLTTARWTNKLIDIVENAKIMENIGKTFDNVSRDWSNYSYIAGEIDEGENYLLNQLKYEWWKRNLHFQLSWANISNFTSNEDWSVTLWECSWTIWNMKNLFYQYVHNESYEIEWTWQTMEGLSTKNTVNNYWKKYYFDYSNCSDSVKQQVRDILSNQNLNELVVAWQLSKYKWKWKITTFQPDNDDNITNLRVEVDVWNVDLYKNLPLSKGLIISDSMAYDWKVKLDKADSQSSLEMEELFWLDIEDSEYEKDPRTNPKLKDLIYYFWWTEEDLTRNELRNDLVKAWFPKYNKFLIETENRIRSIVSFVRKSQWRLCTPPIDKWKIRFTDSNGKEFKIEIRDSDWWTGSDLPGFSNLWKDIYCIIKDHKDEYDQYLTTSVLSKWSQTVFLAPEKSIIKNHETTDGISDVDLLMGDSAEINAYIYALKQILNIATDYANNVWDTGSDKDQKLANVVDFLGYSISNLESWKYFSREEIRKNIINKLDTRFCPLCEKVMGTSQKALAHNEFNSIFAHIRNNNNPELPKILLMCRNLSAYYNYAWNFWQWEEIMQLTDESWSRMIQIWIWKTPEEQKEYKKYNEWLQKIDQLFKLDAQFDKNWNLIPNNQTKNIDELYNIANSSADWKETREKLYVRLVRKWIIPEDFYKKENILKVDEIMENILKNIEQRKRELESNRPTTTRVLNDLSSYYLSLHNKWNRTEDENNVLSNLEAFFDMDQNAKNECIEMIIQKNKMILKYQWVNNDLFSPLCKGFAEYAGSTNSIVLNQIHWFWWYLSDASSIMMGEMCESVLLTIATWYIWGWVMKAWSCVLKLGKTLIRGSETAMNVINSSKWLLNNVYNCSKNLWLRCFNAIKSKYPESAEKLANAANKRAKVNKQWTDLVVRWWESSNVVTQATTNWLGKWFRNFLKGVWKDAWKEKMDSFIENVWSDKPPFQSIWNYGDSNFSEALKSVVTLWLNKWLNMWIKRTSNIVSLNIWEALKDDDLPSSVKKVIENVLTPDVVNYLVNTPIQFSLWRIWWNYSDIEKYLWNIAMELVCLGNPISKKFSNIYWSIWTDVLKKISKASFSIFYNEWHLCIQEPNSPYEVAKLDNPTSVKELTEKYST